MIRFAIVGTNFISDAFVEALTSLSCAEITAVYSRKLDTGRTFADKYGISSVFCDYDEMLASHLFDAVYVASPTLLPCTPFQYTLEATGIPDMVKYLFIWSNAAVVPPRLATVIAAAGLR